MDKVARFQKMRLLSRLQTLSDDEIKAEAKRRGFHCYKKKQKRKK